jgi:hypothetical protein
MSMSEYVNMSDSDDLDSSDDEVMFAVASALCLTKFRGPVEFRKRWDLCPPGPHTCLYHT